MRATLCWFDEEGESQGTTEISVPKDPGTAIASARAYFKRLRGGLLVHAVAKFGNGVHVLMTSMTAGNAGNGEAI